MRFLAAFLLMANIAYAGNLTLQWNSAPQDQKGFKVYWGKTSHADIKRPLGTDSSPYENVATINDPGSTSYKLWLNPGTYYVRITVFGDAGIDSNFSNEVVAHMGYENVSDLGVLVSHVDELLLGISVSNLEDILKCLEK